MRHGVNGTARSGPRQQFGAVLSRILRRFATPKIREVAGKTFAPSAAFRPFAKCAVTAIALTLAAAAPAVATPNRWQPCHRVDGTRASAGLVHVRAIRCQPVQTMIFQWLENRYPKRPHKMHDDDGHTYRCRSVLRQGKYDPYLHVLCKRRAGAFWFDVGS